MTRDLSLLEKAVVSAVGVVVPIATYLNNREQYVDLKAAAGSLVFGGILAYVVKKACNSGEPLK